MGAARAPHRGWSAVVLASTGVLFSVLGLIAAVGDDEQFAGPALGLALAASVWWALHRLCTSGSLRAERLALGGVLLLALAPLLHSRVGLITSMPAVFALAGGFALTPRPSGKRALERAVASSWLAGAALAWSLLLIVAALVLPLYSGTMHTSAGASVETSATIVEINGTSALIPVSIPAAVCALAFLLLHLARRLGSSAAHHAAAGLAFLLAAFAFVTGFSIGFLVLPAAIALLTAVAMGDPEREGAHTPGPERSQQGTPRGT